MQPTPERFAALARSSPWRWHTLRFEASWSGPWAQQPVRAWVARPDGLRVEALDGTLQTAVRQPANRGVLLSADGTTRPEPPPPPRPAPRFDADGLVAARVEPYAEHDDPMWQDYRWVAMLDPVELADGTGRHTPHPEPHPVQVSDLRAVEHHGRPAWQALLVPTAAYDPRCACCPLLRSAVADAYEGLEADAEYAEAHRVRLDVQTGVCVLTEELGGGSPGSGHDLVLLAVDEDLPDALFTGPRPRGWRRG